MGSEQPGDVELLCAECHTKADEARAAKGRPNYFVEEESWIVGPDGGARWGKFDPDTIYLPLPDGRNVPLGLRWKGKS